VGKAICILGQKGDGGKSITVVNLAAALALSGRRTLLIDIDPQGSATDMVSVMSRRHLFSFRDVMMQGVPIERAVVQGCLHHLKVLPAPLNGSRNDRMHVGRPNLPGRLRTALVPVKDDFEYILMDTPASDWSFLFHAAVASDYLLFVLRADILSFNFLGKRLDIIKTIKKRFNPQLKLGGIILTQYDPNDEACTWILQEALRHLPKWLFRTLIPKDRAIAASALVEKPIVVSNYDGKGARSFRFLVDEFVARIG
jgi:chromosome partitioning protein